MERVTMPQLGETVTEGTITRWIKQVGDAVEVDDALFEVSTDKVETEVPPAAPGVLRQILVPEGDTVPIGTPLAVTTATADEPLDDAPAAATAPVTAPAEVDGAPSRAAAAGPGRRGVGLAERAPARRAQAPAALAPHTGFPSPPGRALPAEHGLDPSEVVGSGRDGRITRADVLAAVAHPPPPPPPGPSAPPPPAARPPRPGPPPAR